MEIASRLEDFITKKQPTKAAATFAQLHVKDEAHHYRFLLSSLIWAKKITSSRQAVSVEKQLADPCGTLQMDAMGHEKAAANDCW